MKLKPELMRFLCSDDTLRQSEYLLEELRLFSSDALKRFKLQVGSFLRSEETDDWKYGEGEKKDSSYTYKGLNWVRVPPVIGGNIRVELGFQNHRKPFVFPESAWVGIWCDLPRSRWEPIMAACSNVFGGDGTESQQQWPIYQNIPDWPDPYGVKERTSLRGLGPLASGKTAADVTKKLSGLLHALNKLPGIPPKVSAPRR